MQRIFDGSQVIRGSMEVFLLCLIFCCVEDANGQEKTFQLGEQAGKEIAFSPDGERVALSAYDFELKEKKIILIDLKAGKVIGACWGGQYDYFQGLSFSKDSKTVISYSPTSFTDSCAKKETFTRL